MLAIGVAHFTHAERFLPAMPPWLWPSQHLFLIHLSGVFEIAGGLGLLAPATAPWGQLRRAAAWGLLALYVAVFPANIHMAVHPELFPDLAPWALWARLPFQLVFLAWAFRYTRAQPGRSNRQETLPLAQAANRGILDGAETFHPDDIDKHSTRVDRWATMSTSAAPTLDRVQDTAAWAAASRAVESSRADALFHDRLAGRFVGTDKEALLELCELVGGTWPVVARTVLIDRLVMDAVEEGVDAVLNLAAGYDTRPYRLVLPRSLVWVDVDHTDVIATRARMVDGENTSCAVERRAVDLADDVARSAFFAEMKERFRRLVVITEGLLYYLPADGALALGRELHALRPHRWIFDLHNAAVGEMIQKRSGGALRGTATMQFAPSEGAAVFEPLGWRIRSVSSSVRAAAGLGRLSWPMALLARLPAPKYGKPGWPWAGVCAAEVARPGCP
jgi:methyltransferase (TIGR00027 family)